MLFREDSAARAQHQAVRENAGWYRWTHDLVEVKGSDSAAFLDYLFVNNISGAVVSRTKYTTMLNEEGKIIDDTIVMHMADDLFWVSTLYAPQMIAWMQKHQGEYSVEFRDMTGEIDMYAIQGPNSPAVLNALLAESAEGLKRFQVMDNKIGEIAVTVHRSGFTGENGFEIYCDMTDTATVGEAIRKVCNRCQAPEVDILEVYVRSLSVEKGFALRQDMYLLTPYECGLDWSVDLNKEFIGKAALLKAKEEGPQKVLVGLEYLAESYEDIAQMEIVYRKGVPCGRVKAAVYGYTVDKNIGYAVIDARKAIEGTEVTVGCNDSPAIIVKKGWI